MLSKHADRYYIFCIALCYMCVSSNGEQYCDDSCETSRLSAPLGSSVLLQCQALQSSVSGLDLVLWAQNPGSSLVNLTSKGNIQFLDPRHGRVKAFPNQGNVGNYSIRIDDLQESDLGCYLCKQADGCQQVDVSERVDERTDVRLVYIVVGVVAIVLLLGVCSYYCARWLWSKSIPDYVNTGYPISAETSRENIARGDEQERGANTIQDVYENEYDPANHHDGLTRNHCALTGILHDLDRNQPTPSGNVHDPTGNPQRFARVESQRRRQGFHIELLSRLQHASFSRHYYVNRVDLNQQAMSSPVEDRHRASFWRKKSKQRYEHENPIYNNRDEPNNV